MSMFVRLGWSYIGSRTVVSGCEVGCSGQCPHIWSQIVVSMFGGWLLGRVVVYLESDCSSGFGIGAR